MIVLKFGGTSVGDGERIAATAQLVSRRARERPLVVASALTGVTDQLLALSRAALTADTTEVDLIAERLRDRHRSAAEQAGIISPDRVPLLEQIDSAMAGVLDLARGVSLTRELTARTADALAAIGELLSSRILAAAIRARGVEAIWIDPRDIVATDRSHGGACPDEEAIAAHSAERIAPELDQGRIVVTGGFVGREPGGETTTLGRGGSDTTAALLGAALHAEAIEIWTDVDGILTADPRIVAGARLIPAISYAEAAELAFFGAKVLHPASIRPAVRRGIPIRVRNSFRPASEGTVITAEAAGSGVRALAARGHTSGIFVTNPRMLFSHGYAARVFSAFERHRIPVDVIATSEVSIAVTVDAGHPLGSLLRELESLADIEVRRNLGVLAIVGPRLRSTPGIGARIFRALQEINVILISQGASETDLTLVLEERELPLAMERLHEEFFGTMPADESAPAMVEVGR